MTTCYLCGKEIQPGEVASKDHVVPMQLLAGQQPKRKGFDYGGHIPTHERCNNEFGPENYAQLALELIPVLHNPSAVLRVTHPHDPSAKFLALNSSLFSHFDQRALKHFKIFDRRSESSPFPALDQVGDDMKTNPVRAATEVALSVLLKSSAALIISRKLKFIPTEWQVLATTYVGDTKDISFNDIIGETKPFGDNIKVWFGRMETDDYFVAYIADQMLVFFLFRFSAGLTGWRHMKLQFRNAPRFTFYGNCINDVIANGWRRV
jgi:hypothetical protein